MVRLYLLLFLSGLSLTVVAVIGCLSAEPDRVRVLSRPVWLLVILLLPVAGAIAWFVTGRPLPVGTAPGQHPASGRTPPRPLAPDDNPEFLRSLDEALGQERSERNQELFEHWEEDLRRRRRADGEELP
ncbi:PLD nuclease N-terminal domain-containing protein [Rhizomonospora bruguierae]|uniref:PLD nuclease N-terminal domain-containing protein n=1 Tax=Rhizomonospora bruguierae TaxID=1581705 RepID=UPI001BCEC8BA|nr:PLD nuclease N-terminal domain-containing protein [Micromonospora sp. NBRC 107566]